MPILLRFFSSSSFRTSNIRRMKLNSHAYNLILHKNYSNLPICESCVIYLLIFAKRSLMKRVRLSRFFICVSCICLSMRATSGEDHDISRLSLQVKSRRTCVDWDGNDHYCYPNKCCPSKKTIQRDKRQSNLGSSGVRNTVYIDNFT